MNLTDVKLDIKHQTQKTKMKQEVAELGNKNVVLKGQEKHLWEFQITESGLRIKLTIAKQTKQKDTKKTKKQTEDIQQ